MTDKTKIINKLGFDLNLINDDELKKEVVYLLNKTLNAYLIDKKLVGYVFTNQLRNKAINLFTSSVYVGSGVNEQNISYDFIVTDDKLSGQIGLRVHPEVQNSFHDNFLESFKLVYTKNSCSIVFDRLYKENNYLINELCSYVRSFDGNLVLVCQKKIFDNNLVYDIERLICKNDDFARLYHDGKYLYGQMFKPISDKLYIISKKTHGQKLCMYNYDTPFILHDGIVIYDYKNRDLDKTVVTKVNDNKEKFLSEMFDDYNEISKRIENEDGFCKTKK